MVKVREREKIEDNSSELAGGVAVIDGVEFVSDSPAEGRREIDRKAKALQDQFKLPKPPGKRDVPFNQFCDYLDLLTPEMWGHAEFYIYRRKPVIDNKLVDPQAFNYIDVVNEPINRDYMLNTHGGGDFGFTLKDRNTDQTVCEASLTIPISEYEPILDYRTLDINSRSNKTYIKRLKAAGILNDEGEVAKPGTTHPTGDTAILNKVVDGLMVQIKDLTERERAQLKQVAGSDPTSQAVIRMMEEGHKRSIAQLEEQTKTRTPNETIDLVNSIMTMVTKLKGDAPAPVPVSTGGPTWSEVMKMQADNNAAMIAILKEKATEVASKGKSGLIETIGEIGQLKELLETLGVTGGRGGGRREWYEAVLENLAPVAERALGTVDKYLDFSIKMAGVPQPPPTNQPQPTPRTQPTIPQVITLPQPHQVQTQENGETTVKTEGPTPVATPEAQILEGAIAMVHAHGALIIEHMNGSGHGALFAESIVNMFGRPMYNRIKALGAETLLKAMESVPDFWKNAQDCLEGTPESVKQWVEEFMGYPETLPPVEEDGDN